MSSRVNQTPPLIQGPAPEAPWLRTLARLFLPLSAVILCAALGFIGIDLWRDRQQIRSDTEQNLHTLAHALAQQTGRTLQAIDLTLVGVTDSIRDAKIDWHDPDNPRVRQILAEKRERAAFVRSLYMIDADGRLVHELNNYPVPELNFSDRPYFRFHQDSPTSKMYVGGPFLSRIINRPILAISRRIETADGVFDGVVTAAIEPGVLEESFKAMDPGENSVIAVFRNDGQVLLRYPAAPLNSTARLSADNRESFLKFSHKALTVVSPVDGVRRIYYSEPVPGAEAFVVVGHAESAIFHSWRRSMIAYVTIAPILLVIFTCLGLLLSGYLTRRESLVRALQQSEIRFRDFAQAASDRLWETDELHRFTWHSGSAGTFMGRTRWEKMDLSAEANEPWRNHKADLDAHRPFRDFVYSRRKDDGSLRYRRISGTPVFDANGTFKGYRGTYRDITAQVLAQQQAAMHRDRFRRAIESLAEGFALYDADDKLVVCNTQFRELSRPIADRLIEGSTFEDFLRAAMEHDLVPEARGCEETWLAQRLTRHRNPPNVIEVVRNGRWYQIREQRDPDGGTLLFVLDIHEQKMTELQNRTLHERVRLQFEYTPAACLLLSPNFDVMDWNPAAEKMFGYTRDEILGKSVYGTIVPASVKPQVDVVLDRLLSGRKSVSAVNENTTKSGEIITCEWLNTPMFDGETCTGIVSMALDVTEKRKAEEKLRQAQRMEAVGQLTGGIAHDFNNLLQVIFGNAEILAQGLKGQPQLGRWAETIQTAAQRGANLTQRLLAFSRQQILAPTTVDLHALISNFIELLNLTFGENIDILADIDDHLGTLTLDVGQLEDALLNLALNARDAMPNGGRLVIAAHALPLPEGEAQGEDKTTSYIALSVSDTGTGMAPSVLKQAFEPFFTTKDVDKGSGLGLSMVYGFVKQSGGHVRIDSQLGRGTTITMWFPQTGVARPAPQQLVSKVGALPTGNERILVVEDDDMVRSYVTTQLESLGYEVFEAADGATALNMLTAIGPVDLLFTDMIMPGQMSGGDLAEAIANHFPTTRILFTSGYTEKVGDGHLHLPPGAQLLRKPYYRQDLARRVREVLDLQIAAAS